MSEKLQNTSCFKYDWVFMVGLVLLAACAGEPTVDPLDIGDPVWVAATSSLTSTALYVSP